MTGESRCTRGREAPPLAVPYEYATLVHQCSNTARTVLVSCSLEPNFPVHYSLRCFHDYLSSHIRERIIPNRTARPGPASPAATTCGRPEGAIGPRPRRTKRDEQNGKARVCDILSRIIIPRRSIGEQTLKRTLPSLVGGEAAALARLLNSDCSYRRDSATNKQGPVGRAHRR